MGTIEVESSSEAVLRAEIILYGSAATEQLAHQLADEIQRMWTVARGKILLDNRLYYLNFLINGRFDSTLKPDEVLYNKNPRNNFIRVEKFVNGNISFMDALGSNTGFFQLDNLYIWFHNSRPRIRTQLGFATSQKPRFKKCW